MKCPVCDENLDSMVCDCGYDASRDYEKYPTLGMLSGSVESVSCLRDRRNNLVRCAGCGYYGFTMARDTGEMKCIRCGQVPMEAEMKSVAARLSRDKANLESLDEVRSVKQRDLNNLLEQIVGMQKYLDNLNHLMGQKKLELDNLNDLMSQKKSELDQLTVYEEHDIVFRDEDLAEVFDQGKPALRIKRIAASYDVTAAVYTDGTVRAIGKADFGRCAVSEWRNVVDVAVCDAHTFGLTEEGTVLCTGRGAIPRMVSKWREIAAISANREGVFGLRKDGRVLAANGGVAKAPIAQWCRIKAISAGHGYVVGLRWDGTVVAAGRNDKGQCEVSGWKGIKSISAGTDYTIGLREDGSAVNTGFQDLASDKYYAVYQNTYQFENENNGGTIYGLHEDRTVGGIYYYPDVLKEMQKWGKMEMLVVVRSMVLGLKADGTVVSADDGFMGVRDVSELNRGVV